MATPLPTDLRIVCTKCLKEARVHFVEQNPIEDSLNVWVECHGKSIIGRLDTEVVLASKAQEFELTFQMFRRTTDADAWLVSTLEHMRTVAQRADKLIAFIRCETADHEGETMQRFEDAGLALMEAVRLHREGEAKR